MMEKIDINHMGKDNLKNKYGIKYQEHLLKQYELYLSGAEKISDRRESANKYFYTLNSGILFSAGFLINSTMNICLILYSLIFLSVFGIIFSVIFWFLINSYKQLNTGKFKVIHKIEKQLPSQPYKDEWVILGEGKNKKLYFSFSHIEKLIPLLFIFIYSLSFIFLVVYLINAFLI